VIVIYPSIKTKRNIRRKKARYETPQPFQIKLLQDINSLTKTLGLMLSLLFSIILYLTYYRRTRWHQSIRIALARLACTIAEDAVVRFLVRMVLAHPQCAVAV